MDEMVARLNISRFRKLLIAEVDEAKRAVLLGLLGEEEKKLTAILETSPQRRETRS